MRINRRTAPRVWTATGLVLATLVSRGVLATVAGATVGAQSPLGPSRGLGRDGSWTSIAVPYDGRYTFARLSYPMGLGGGGFRREPPWSHDYPTADRHMARILSEISTIDAWVDGSNVFAVDSAELARYPVAYMAEPGYWTLTEEQARAFRAYLLKGGFVIFDDFRDFHLDNFEAQLRRVLPEARLVELDGTHAVFHAFFEIDSPLDFVPPYDQQLQPRFLGVFEDNDPDKRLMIVANYNNDLGEYWEFSDTGYAPVDLSNEAYKFGVNYVMYALTH